MIVQYTKFDYRRIPLNPQKLVVLNGEHVFLCVAGHEKSQNEDDVFFKHTQFWLTSGYALEEHVWLRVSLCLH